MTVREALTAKIRYIRLPEWHEGAHIELPVGGTEGHGPWAIVRDAAGEQTVWLSRLDSAEDRYEATEGPFRLGEK